VDVGSLRAAITARSRAVLVVHPNNPTGSFMKPAEAAALREICAANDMAIIADEVFLDFAADAKPRASFAFTTEALTFALSGLSKISALPQMKLAWLIANGPEKLLRPALDRLEIIADTFLSPGTPVQLALPKLLELRHAMQSQIQARVSANLAHLDTLLAGHKSIARLDREGGWYAVLRVPATQPDEELAVALLSERDVLVHPGRFFDFPQDGYLVVSLITPDPEFREGIARLVEFIGARAN
jgi:alanine-synthesizing transaminase